MSRLFAGASRTSVSPLSPVPLAGFANRDRYGYTAVDSGISVRCFYLRDGTMKEALVVCSDLLCYDSELAAAFKIAIRNRTGIPGDAVILHATHNHSGPSVRDFIGIWRVDPDYVNYLLNQILSGALAAKERAVEVTVERGIGVCTLGANRRKPLEGKIELAYNPDGPADPELNVIRFKGNDGSVIAAWIHYTCHPVVNADNRLSSEFCGAAVERLERQLGETAVVGYLQGCCGDINPYWPGDTKGYAAIVELGNRLADDAECVMKSAMKPVPCFGVDVRRATAELPFARLPTTEELECARHSGIGYQRLWADYLLRRPDLLKPSATLDLTLLTLSDGLSLLFMNGEMVVRYGLFVRELSAGAALPVAYTNGMIGYVTTAAQLSEGGYEPVESVTYFGLPAPFDVRTESIVLREFEKMLLPRGLRH